MKIHVLSLFPEIVEGYFGNSIMARAVKSGRIELNLINFRDFAHDRHNTCDDAPYGGGAGMVIKPAPLGEALESIGARNKWCVYPSPSGKLFSQKKALELSRRDECIFICGRYEGIDQRIIDTYVNEEISVGDYVLSSGEIASLTIIDAVYRLVDGVINCESLEEESFSDGLLEYPHYTRPETYNGMAVPPVLLSGHHAEIDRWRRKERLKKTLKNRPDLLDAADLSREDKKVLDDILRGGNDGNHGSD
jgi:tRNA (guanine37-N1)-methyltransferase